MRPVKQQLNVFKPTSSYFVYIIQAKGRFIDFTFEAIEFPLFCMRCPKKNETPFFCVFMTLLYVFYKTILIKLVNKIESQ